MAVETERVQTERVREIGPRGPLGSPTDEGRRLSTAGRALVVMVLALVLAALLNAQNIYKSVYNKPEGTQRKTRSPSRASSAR